MAAEQLEIRTLPAGTVNIAMVGANLIITGDVRANQIDVYIDFGGISVVGRETTQVKYNNIVNAPGVSVPVGPLGRATNLNIALGNGNDRARVLFVGDREMGGINVDLGNGNDLLVIAKIERVEEFEDEGPITSITLNQPLIIDGGTGNDVVDLQFGGFGAVRLSAVTIDLGVGNDLLELEASDLTVRGDTSITGGLGNDTFESYNEGTMLFQQKLTIEMGGHSDHIEMRSGFADEPTLFHVVGYFRVDASDLSNVSDQADDVFLNDNFRADSFFTVHTRNGNDKVFIRFGDESGQGESRVGADFVVDTGTDKDIASIVLHGNLTVVGSVQVQTGIGDDELSILAGGNLMIGRDFTVDTNANRDMARIFSVFAGQIHVGNNLNLSAGAGNDCLLVGSLVFDDDDDAIPFQVVGNATITGDEGITGRGDDFIGIGGLEVMGNLDVRAADGKNVIDLFNVGISGDLTVDTGKDADLIAAQFLFIGGDTKLRTGSGNDRVLVSLVTFGGSALVDLGAGNDQVEVGPIRFEGRGEPSITLDGGSGIDAFDSATEFGGVVVRNFESDLANEINEVDGELIDDSVFAALDRCFDSFSYDIEDEFDIR